MGGADPAYVTHLLTHGQVVVGVSGGSVSMLCDLFVDPRMHGGGCGRAMLAGLWPVPGPRMTFSSLDTHALPLCTSFGPNAWWPLLYLTGRAAALTAPSGWTVEAIGPAEVGTLKLAWTGTDRFSDHRVWARRPDGVSVVARRDGQVMAAGTIGGAGDAYGLTHLALEPRAGRANAVAAVFAVLASLGPQGRSASVCLPGPHPAVRALLAAGWRVAEFDLFMATDPSLLDPRQAVPSPALA